MYKNTKFESSAKTHFLVIIQGFTSEMHLSGFHLCDVTQVPAWTVALTPSLAQEPTAGREDAAELNSLTPDSPDETKNKEKTQKKLRKASPPPCWRRIWRDFRERGRFSLLSCH